jgi:hypothetical protein
MNSVCEEGFIGAHVPVAKLRKFWLGLVVWVNACPQGKRTSSLKE